jgi:hypothetical protein
LVNSVPQIIRLILESTIIFRSQDAVGIFHFVDEALVHASLLHLVFQGDENIFKKPDLKKSVLLGVETSMKFNYKFGGFLDPQHPSRR